MAAFSQFQFFGVLIGTFLFGALSDMFGRKSVAVGSLTMGFLSAMISGHLTFAPTWQILHGSRFLLGLSLGGALVTQATFVTELILPQQRMLLRGAFNWGIARIMLTTICLIVQEWRAACITSALILLIAILSIALFFPESPTWLHNKGRLDDMRASERHIAKFAGVKYEPVQHKHIERVKTFTEMWRTPGLTQRLVVLWPLWFVAAFCSYGIDLNSNSISGNLYVNQMLFGVLIAISKLILLAVDTYFSKFSRRLLHQGSLLVVSLCFLTLTILTIQQYTGTGVLIVNLIGVVFMEYTWDACFLCTIESLETSCRSSGTGSCSLMARVGAITAPLLTYMNNFWAPTMYFSVFVMASISLLISYKFLIETKGVDLDNVTIEPVFEPHIVAELVQFDAGCRNSAPETANPSPLIGDFVWEVVRRSLIEVLIQ
ncbi:unnamed protein product [Nippostrongylus brasiliensis]|uniref:MFS domain-containing protein n=1 Tax=Nippostrongylus brasiliensis TaxID=27835 RepID=A0A0N4Y053_NIPBR|nr:unnamed protein product [Nippostrongylus brasiliensis]